MLGSDYDGGAFFQLLQLLLRKLFVKLI